MFFRDGLKDNVKLDLEEVKNLIFGIKIVSNEVYYFYLFIINLLVYKEFVEFGVIDGYIKDDYKKFKKIFLVLVIFFVINLKVGCENEFGLFVEIDEDLYFFNLLEYISFYKGESKNIIELNCLDLINLVLEKVKFVEIYYNFYIIEIKFDIKGVKIYNIFI